MAAPLVGECSDLWSQDAFSDYLKNVRAYHGFIRFLGMPTLLDNPDIPIDHLYVSPILADQRISPDTDPSQWPATMPLLDKLGTDSYLVLLGDPGCGKSTIADWLAYHFALPGRSALKHRFGPLLPIPMVLRELHISADIDWDGLLRAFLDHDMAKPLKPLSDGNTLIRVLQEGQAFIILDGLDEIGSADVRRSLRDAIQIGMERYPECRWMVTSRIVGYENVPLYLPESFYAEFSESDYGGFRYTPEAHARIPEAYVAPFNDQQIAVVARNWYLIREHAEVEAEKKATALVNAIMGNDILSRLARVPNLLIMMALIHRIKARLPNGRALLYHEITEAYLESIEEAKALPRFYPLAQKKRWLARVGFQMQQKRRVQGQREILASEDEVEMWVRQAMEESERRSSEDNARTFIDHIGRRSGLLLPRGNKQYAFMHLSFQEYFAACFLEDKLMAPSWLPRDFNAAEELPRLADQAVWRETMLFLDEVLADKPPWPLALANILFTPDFRRVWRRRHIGEGEQNRAASTSAAALLADLALDPHSGFSADMRKKAIDVCCRREIQDQQAHSKHEMELLHALLGRKLDESTAVWNTFVSACEDATRLTLERCAAVQSLVGLERCTTLTDIDISYTSVRNLDPLRSISSLRTLRLRRTAVIDLSPIAGLSNLEVLDISSTNVSDLSALHGLKKLKFLDFSNMSVSDASPILGISSLIKIVLFDSRIPESQHLRQTTPYIEFVSARPSRML